MSREQALEIVIRLDYLLTENQITRFLNLALRG